MYHALYRKYRPQTFDDVIGQDSIVKVLKNSIKNHKFSHAYLFFGSRGVGKTSLSKIFAKAVNCLDSSDGNPCGKCKNCMVASENQAVDILEIDAASNNGVDEIRELRNKINLVPTELKYKVYIIDEVHMLSIGAFNALLKTLEEPPEHAIFILATTDPQKVPETIISRCQCFSFQRISQTSIVNRLEYVCKKEGIDIDSDVLNEIALSSDGGMRDSLGMLDKLSSYTTDKITMDIYTELNGLVTYRDLEKFSDSLFSKDYKGVLKDLENFNNCGKNLVQIISQFMYFLRDKLVNYYVNSDNMLYSVHDVEKIVNLINEKMFDIKKSSNPRIYVEILLLTFMSNLDQAEKSMKPLDIKKTKSSTKTVEKDNSTSFDDNPSNYVEEKTSTNDNITETSFVSNDLDDTVSSIDHSAVALDDFMHPILNIEEIIKVRVNNALALANKKILNEEIHNLNILNDYTFDQKIGYLVCEILNSKFRVASEDIIVISYEYDSIVKQNLLHLEQMEKVYYELTHSKKEFAIISDEEWKRVKTEYITKLKSGNHYEVLEEPTKEFKKEEEDDIILSDTTSLFGDIVEID